MPETKTAPPAADASPQPASPPTSRHRHPSGGLTFREPAETPEQPLGLDPTTTGSSDLLAGSPSDSGGPSDTSGEPSEATSSKASSGSPAPLSPTALRDAVRAAVRMVGSIAHRLLARDQLDHAVGLYLADDDDAEQIGDPLASIASRRGGVAGAAGNPDVADAIASLIGLAVYVSKQLDRRWVARDERRHRLQGTVEAYADRVDVGGAAGSEAPVR